MNVIFSTIDPKLSEKCQRVQTPLDYKNDALPQIREQMYGPDLHVFTLKFLALKKLVFPP